MTNKNKRYNQPSPRKGDRMNTNGNTNQSGQNAKQSKQNPKQGKQRQQQQQSDGLIFVNYIFKGLNSIGEFILSDIFINTIQKIFQEHLNLLNYILKNLNSNYFWELNLKYSLLLTIILFIKGLFEKNFLSFELTGIISVICFLVLKILDSKGDTLESTYTATPYNTDKEIINKEEGDSESYKEVEELEPVFTKVEDQAISEAKSIVEPDKEVYTANNQSDKVVDDVQDSLANIQRIYNQVKSPTLEPTKEILEQALVQEDHLRQRLQYNQVMAQLQNRDLLKSAMQPLEDMKRSGIHAKNREEDNEKFENLINKLEVKN